jgi:c-di-GMP-binding flagellar brake protein YcgR
MEHKRMHQRTIVAHDLDISLRKLGDAERIPVLNVDDFSLGGMKVISSAPCDVGEDVDIKIELSDYRVKFIAEVKRCLEVKAGQYDMGLEFITLSSKNLEKMYDLFIIGKL